VEQPVLIAAVIVLYLVVRHWAARRLMKGDRRGIWILFAPAIGGATVAVLAGVRIATVSPVLGGVVIVVGAVTLTLLVRALLVDPAALTSGVPETWVRYFVWASLGAPIVLALALLAAAITGQLK
jgi:hypothetical protein